MHALPHRIVAALAGVAMASASAAAQGASAQGATSGRPTFGVAAGAAIPTGEFGDFASTGFTVGAHLGFSSASLPVGFRLEGTYQRHDAKGSTVGNPRFNIISGVANVIAGGTAAPGSVRPYFIGGGGVYNFKATADGFDSESVTKFGLNGGAGIDLPLSGIAAFAEVRFHYVFTAEDDDEGNTSFVPITVGVRF
jgi:hypothetical protein